MPKLLPMALRNRVAALRLACLVYACIGSAMSAEPSPSLAAALLAKYAELGPQLGDNPFKRPLYLQSTESPHYLKGDIYALLDHPFATVDHALDDPTHWCDVLILHLNTKYCRAGSDPATASTVLAVSIGSKTWESLDRAYRVNFVFNAAATTPGYLDVTLAAQQGPLGTSDYRIQLEAVPTPDGKTFLHLTYSYTYDFSGALAMRGYLATIGSGKVGFTNIGPAGGPPEYIGGVRGVVERNTMRYYLAIDAYLDALSAPPAEQFEQRLQEWFSATEHYPRQLHEIDRATYLDMKRREVRRQQTAP